MNKITRKVTDKKINTKFSQQIRGGIQLSDDYIDAYGTDPLNAIDYFVENSTFEILTNDSISCITLVATLDEDYATPFLSVRSNTLSADVRKLLLKVFITFPGIGPSEPPISGKDDPRIWKKTYDRGSYKGIEITSFEDFDKEVDIQREIYRKSLIAIDSPLDAICPAIVYVEKDIPLPRDVDGYYPVTDHPILHKLLSLNLRKSDLDDILLYNDPEREQSISIIFMELLDGYKKASELIHYDDETRKFVPENDRQKFYLYAIQYEFRRLNKFGYKHGDAHLGNVMINTRYRYFSDGIYPIDDLTIIEEPLRAPPGLVLPSSEYEEIPEGRIQILSGLKGRAIILDFGRSSRLTADEIDETNDFDSVVFTREKYYRAIHNDYRITQDIYSQLCEKRYNIISRYTAPPLLDKYQNEVSGFVVPEYHEPCDGNARSSLLHQLLEYILGLGLHIDIAFTNGGRLKTTKDSIRLTDSYSLNSSHKEENLTTHNVKTLSKDSFAKEIKSMTKEEIKTILLNAYNNTLLHKKSHTKKQNKTKRKYKNTPKSRKSRK